MSKIGESLLRGAKEALEYAKGRKRASRTHHVKIPEKIDVGAIRDSLHMSQNAFAACFGFSIRTIEKWEQGVRQPAGAARAYLLVIANDPDAVRAALSRPIPHARTKHKATHRRERAHHE